MKISIRRISILLIFGILFSFNSFAFAKEEPFVILAIINNSGWDIREIYFTPSGHTGWGNNRAKYGISNGTAILSSYNPDYSYYDFKIVFANGMTKYWLGAQRMNLAKKGSIEIKYVGKDSDGNHRFFMETH